MSKVAPSANADLGGSKRNSRLVGVLATTLDPTHEQHFHNHVAGQDFSQALLFTCTPALLIAGLVGVFGARWMKGDIAVAERADQLAKG